MSGAWRFETAFPALARLPTTVPWHVAQWLGRDPRGQRRATRDFLVKRFSQVFERATAQQCQEWADRHLSMVAHESFDAFAMHRLGREGGPKIDLSGWEHVECLMREGRGFILVLNHFDRLLAAPIALGLRGVTLNTLTMPILDNTGLDTVQRQFLMNKIASFNAITRGQWRTSDQSLRPVHEGLRAGQAWIILADVWDAGFTNLRGHPFLGGELRLPTGIERLARSTGAALLHAVTYSHGATRLSVHVEPLPQEPVQAIDRVIERLDGDVRQRPWAWWHWGWWEQMWHPRAVEETCDTY